MSEPKKFLVPDTVLRTEHPTKEPVKTPLCPACGAKFSHSPTLLQCTKCGLPDEVRDFGPRVIARWQKQKERAAGMSKSEIKHMKSVLARGSKHKRKAKHGRQGNKVAGVKAPRYRRMK